ncbi:MAG TPA: hypothetical protein VFP91_02820 [Vicinamibacterales bacterium]|nr:hypothetical protein [Vicinamibacterales bacterium]
MKTRLSIVICVACFFCEATAARVIGAQVTPADFSRADAATVRLTPSAFSNLPLSVRTAMQRRGCTVPQPAGSARARNVVSGHFTNAGTTDWAVLCSRERRSSVLVFHGNNFSDVDSLAESADSDYLQTVPGGRIGFSRVLSVAAPNIVRQSRATGKPRVIDHDGIVDAFEGKGSTIWYWSGEKWISSLGSD